jgi:hypothetical protein
MLIFSRRFRGGLGAASSVLDYALFDWVAAVGFFAEDVYVDHAGGQAAFVGFYEQAGQVGVLAVDLGQGAQYNGKSVAGKLLVRDLLHRAINPPGLGPRGPAIHRMVRQAVPSE